MKRVPAAVRQGRRVMSEAAGGLLSVLLMGSALGCGPLEVPTEAAPPATHTEALQTTNGLSVNGLSVNGLSVNGLSVNGLSVNGLSVNGLSSAAFGSWFNEAPSVREVVMRYVVLCAVPSGQERVYTSPLTGKTYRWSGQLGLAPDWAGGAAATVAEQQVVSACLAAHTNKYGLNVSISVLGTSARGVAISYSAAELATYSEEEACFFGNLFNGEGIFAANDRDALDDRESTARACGLSAKYGTTECLPLTHLGQCETYCTKGSSSMYYKQCTYKGVSYRPITTRLRTEDIYRCGDRVCQFTESCGTDDEYDNCMADCGTCR